MIEVSPQGMIDHAEQAGPVIAHFTAAGELVLLEVLDASAFLSAAVRAALRGEEQLIPTPNL